MYKNDSMLMTDESMLEVLQIGGFDWNYGKVWAPQGNGPMRVVVQHDAMLLRSYSGSSVYALDQTAAFVIAATDAIVLGKKHKIALPIKIDRDTVNFLNVKIKHSMFNITLQAFFDREGIFCGTGNVVRLPSMEFFRHAIAFPTRQLHVAGIRACGAYVSGHDQEGTLECLANELQNTLTRLAHCTVYLHATDDVHDLLGTVCGRVNKTAAERNAN